MKRPRQSPSRPRRPHRSRPRSPRRPAPVRRSVNAARLQSNSRSAIRVVPALTSRPPVRRGRPVERPVYRWERTVFRSPSPPTSSKYRTPARTFSIRTCSRWNSKKSPTATTSRSTCSFWWVVSKHWFASWMRAIFLHFVDLSATSYDRLETASVWRRTRSRSDRLEISRRNRFKISSQI